MGRVSEVLFWISGSLLIAFHLGVALLRATGLLRFTYTAADRYSYLYHMKEQHRLMRENRRKGR